ncbi:hypothetical protein PG994_012954 [Apiospora phragmitis]|uniref:Uncharacterized protein n=1 Tax=Apiospora phragmitis TaxID=2905665 RepID=A0ABR1T8Y6_9PEZI
MQTVPLQCVPNFKPRNPPRNASRLAGEVKAVSRECVVAIPASETENEPWYAKRANCTIGTESSFKILGGFCEGAFIFKEGGGQAATIASLEQGNKVTVARCIDCKYRHTLSEIEMDSNPKCEKSTVVLSQHKC